MANTKDGARFIHEESGLREFIRKGLVDQQGLEDDLVQIAMNRWNDDLDPVGPFEHGVFAVIVSIFEKMEEKQADDDD
jgi:hypothetical protein